MNRELERLDDFRCRLPKTGSSNHFAEVQNVAEIYESRIAEAFGLFPNQITVMIHPDTPAPYRHVGQPVLIPGDMGRYSYVMAGTARALDETFGSACHGAGRLMSRSAAKRAVNGRSLLNEMQARGVHVMAAGMATVAEEMPEAYKDVADVVNVVHGAGLATRVVQLRPLGVIKG